MAYEYLTFEDLHHLHDYFKPSKDWTDAESLEHRRQVTTKRPGLLAAAGRARARIDGIAPRLPTFDRIREPATA